MPGLIAPPVAPTGLRPLAILRLDPALVERVRDGRDLPVIAGRALVSILAGGAAYGAVFGLWRAPEAALGSALKLPLVFLGVVLFTTLSSSLLAPALRSRLTTARAAVAALASFATTATVLGALSPVVALVVLSLSPVDPRALGLSSSDPLAVPPLATAQALVLGHTAVIAAAGIAGVLRLLALLERLGDAPAVARRVVLGWIATQFLVGAELSWRLRPFLGAPTTEVRFLAPDAFDGSFFEEIARLGAARFGAGAPFVLALALVVVVAWLFVAMRTRAARVTAVIEPDGLLVTAAGTASSLVPWRRVARARAHDLEVVVTLAADEALDEHTLMVCCRDEPAAVALAAAIERARTEAGDGPFRTRAA